MQVIGPNIIDICLGLMQFTERKLGEKLGYLAECLDSIKGYSIYRKLYIQMLITQREHIYESLRDTISIKIHHFMYRV